MIETAQSAKCPFYGFRWPPQTNMLAHVGGDECGLDFEGNGPCRMEAGGATPDYEACPLRERFKPVLLAFQDQIAFSAVENMAPVRFPIWRDSVMGGMRQKPGPLPG